MSLMKDDSGKTTYDMKTEFGVPAKMRDGTTLKADIYRPDDDARYPVILLRTPYDKNLVIRYFHYLFNPIRAVKAGYIVIVQDVRGRYESEGEFNPFLWEKVDGYDTVEWASKQPWSNGKVGMTGPSYLGFTQYAAASAQPPQLKAIFPLITGTLKDLVYNGGAFNLHLYLFWSLVLAQDQIMRKELPVNEKMQGVLKSVQLFEDIHAQCAHLPLKNNTFFKTYDICKFYEETLEHFEFDQYWDDRDIFDPDKIDIPAYQVNGWYDLFPVHFEELSKKNKNNQIPGNHKLLIGPWAHRADLHKQVGEIDMGLFSGADVVDLTGIQIRWFDYWLKGIENGIMDDPPVRIFVMGEKVWRNEREWPLARTEYTKYFLHSRGSANSLNGDGFLNTNPPTDEPFDSFIYDPMQAVPTKGGALLDPFNQGPSDQRLVEGRNDILIYTSAPLENKLEVTGPILMKLYASSSAIDTDFTAKLLDVWPDGSAYNLQEGIIRARYRNGQNPGQAELIEEAKIYEYTIDLWATSNVFLPGHSIRVEISSSNFPKHDRNLNTGEPFADSIDWKVAEQKIYHTQNYASHIILPVIPREK